MHHFIIELLEKKAQIYHALVHNHDEMLDVLVRQVFVDEQFVHIQPHVSVIAYENIIATAHLKRALSTIMGSQTYCLFVHGSTGKGRGHIAPNIDFSLQSTDDGLPFMKTRVLAGCRDDVDCVLVVQDTDMVKPLVPQIKQHCCVQGIDITLNIVTQDDMVAELSHSDSPAMRRILLFNRPKCLYGTDIFTSMIGVAQQHQSYLDGAHELDFRLLMRVAGMLHAQHMDAYTFSPAELLLVFPTLYVSQHQHLHIGFPQNRIKLVLQG